MLQFKPMKLVAKKWVLLHIELIRKCIKVYSSGIALHTSTIYQQNATKHARYIKHWKQLHLDVSANYRTFLTSFRLTAFLDHRHRNKIQYQSSICLNISSLPTFLFRKLKYYFKCKYMIAQIGPLAFCFTCNKITLTSYERVGRRANEKRMSSVRMQLLFKNKYVMFWCWYQKQCSL